MSSTKLRRPAALFLSIGLLGVVSLSCGDSTGPGLRLEVSPTSLSMTIGQTAQITVTVRDENNNTVNTGATITWSTGNAAVATVTQTGMVTAVGEGSTQISGSATVDGAQVSGSIDVTVTGGAVATVEVPATATVSVGNSSQLSATLKNAQGAVLTGRTVTWASSATSVVTVSNTGVITGVSEGTANVTATSEGQSGTTAVTVSAVPVASVVLNVDSTSVAVGATVTLTATTLDSAGGTLTGRPISWSSTQTSVATVNSSGVVSGVSAGTTTIIATSEGKADSATVTVTGGGGGGTVVTVEVTGPASAVQPGGTLQLTAVGKDAGGIVVGGQTPTWASTDNAVATVNSSGLVTGVADGSVSIIATIQTVSDTFALQVISPGSQICEATGGNSCFYMDSAATGACTFADPCSPATLKSTVSLSAGDYAYFMAGPSSVMASRTYIGAPGQPVFGQCDAGVTYKGYPGDSIIFDGQQTELGSPNAVFIVRIICDNVTFEHVTIKDNRSGLQVEQADFVTVRHVVCDSIIAVNGGGNDGCLRTENAFNTTFEYNTLIDFFALDGSRNVNGLQETGFSPQGDHIFRYNLFIPRENHNQNGILQKKHNSEGTTLEIYGNVFAGVGGGFVVSTLGYEAHVHHNLVLGGWQGFDWGRDPGQIDSATVIEYNTISSSTGLFVTASNHGFNFGNEFKNNIARSTTASWTSGSQMIVMGRFQSQSSFDTYAADYLFTNNCYFAPAGFEVQWWPWGPGGPSDPIVGGINDGDFAAWQAAGKDAGSFEEDPLFNSDTQDLSGNYAPGAANCTSFGVYGDSTLAQFPAPGTIHLAVGVQKDPLAP